MGRRQREFKYSRVNFDDEDSDNENLARELGPPRPAGGGCAKTLRGFCIITTILGTVAVITTVALYGSILFPGTDETGVGGNVTVVDGGNGTVTTVNGTTATSVVNGTTVNNGTASSAENVTKSSVNETGVANTTEEPISAAVPTTAPMTTTTPTATNSSSQSESASKEFETAKSKVSKEDSISVPSMLNSGGKSGVKGEDEDEDGKWDVRRREDEELERDLAQKVARKREQQLSASSRSGAVGQRALFAGAVKRDMAEDAEELNRSAGSNSVSCK